jgi:hypothetical protein
MNMMEIFNMISKYNTLLLSTVDDMKISYNDIYVAVYYWLDCYPKFNYLFQINYFKKFYEILIKNILYSKINDTYKKNIYDSIIIDDIVLIDFINEMSIYIDMML